MADPRPTYFDYINTALVGLVGSGHRVLDVGCGAGAIGEAIAQAGNQVTGVDLAADSIELARPRLTRALVHDVTDVEGLARSLGERFDTIVFSDILEHLVEPGPVLASYRALLSPGGRVIVSVPNVAAWTVRLALLVGWWDYADSGIMDRTHLRFFTRTTARRMIEGAGYRVGRWGLTPHLARAIWPIIKSLRMRGPESTDRSAILRSPAYASYRRWVEPVEAAVARLLPGLLACQFVFEGHAPGSPVPAPEVGADPAR